MTEYIERAALKQELAPYEENDFSQQMDVILAIVDAQPTADVAPVVRCRECKHYREHRTKKYGNLICRCMRMGKYDMDYPVRPDDFCSYGERR